MTTTSDHAPRLRLTLAGPAAEGGRLRLDVLVDIGQAMQMAVTRLALALRGEATLRRGRPPGEIAELTRLELVGLRAGSTVLELELAEHERPFDHLDIGVQAIETLEDGLVALATGSDLPARWDHGVLDAVEHLTRVLERGIDEIVVERLHVPNPRKATVTKAVRERLTGEAPPTGERRRVEIEGRLLMADFAAARDQARIHRPLDPPVRCTFPPELESAVLRLLRRYVRAVGWAEVDEGGRMRVLELESLEDAEPAEGRSFWDLPTLDELAEEQGVEPVERIEDLGAGFWPEDESVDEFLAAIESRE